CARTYYSGSLEYW
nr:immunoglobulin heavy chain junction region [Macaca mulatta]